MEDTAENSQGTADILRRFEARLAEARITHPNLLLPPSLERALDALRRGAQGAPLPTDLHLAPEQLTRNLLMQLERAKAANPPSPPAERANAMDYLGITWVICLGLGFAAGSIVTYWLWLGAGHSRFELSAIGQVFAGGIVGMVLGGLLGFPIAGLVGLLARLGQRQ